MWNTIKNIIFKYGGSLITEQANGTGAVLSLGRISFLALFGLAFWMWAPFLGGADGKGLPGDMLTMLMTLAGYNLGSKVVGIFAEVKAAQKGDALVKSDAPGA